MQDFSFTVHHPGRPVRSVAVSTYGFDIVILTLERHCAGTTGIRTFILNVGDSIILFCVDMGIVVVVAARHVYWLIVLTNSVCSCIFIYVTVLWNCYGQTGSDDRTKKE